MTINITIHDMISALCQKGAVNRQLRAIVQTSYGMSCYRFYMSRLHKRKQVATNVFQIPVAYKSPKGLSCVTYTLVM